MAVLAALAPSMFFFVSGSTGIVVAEQMVAASAVGTRVGLWGVIGSSRRVTTSGVIAVLSVIFGLGLNAWVDVVKNVHAVDTVGKVFGLMNRTATVCSFHFSVPVFCGWFNFLIF